MRHDPNPFNPATEYDRFRKSRDERAQRDERTREPPPPPEIKIDANTRHGEDQDICPERDEEGYCKPSKRDRPELPFYCMSGKSYKGCGIYIKEKKK